jgi:hypothetical protein
MARKVIPEDIRAAYGKREEKPTWPGHLSETQAKRQYAEWLSEVEGRVDRLRRQERGEVVDLSHRDTLALAGRWYVELKQQFEDNPGDPAGWEAALEAMQPDMSPEDTEAPGGLPYAGPWLPQRHIVGSPPRPSVSTGGLPSFSAVTKKRHHRERPEDP